MTTMVVVKTVGVHTTSGHEKQHTFIMQTLLPHLRVWHLAQHTQPTHMQMGKKAYLTIEWFIIIVLLLLLLLWTSFRWG